MKRIICCLIVVFLYFSSLSMAVGATGTDTGAMAPETDLDAVDWSTIDWNTVPPGTLNKWIESQEDLNKLFSVYDKLPEFDYSWSITLTNRLLADPANFMRALAKEKPEAQEFIANSLSSSVYHGIAPGFSKFPNTIYSTKLTADDSEETRNVLILFKNAVEKHWGSPQTGDHVGVAVALLAFSALTGGTLLTQKKKFII